MRDELSRPSFYAPVPYNPKLGSPFIQFSYGERAEKVGKWVEEKKNTHYIIQLLIKLLIKLLQNLRFQNSRVGTQKSPLYIEIVIKLLINY